VFFKPVRVVAQIKAAIMS